MAWVPAEVSVQYESLALPAQRGVLLLLEEALPYLDKPLKRLAIPDVPISTARHLAEYIVPSSAAIEAGVRELVG